MLIVEPHAGGGRTGRELPRVERTLAEMGVPHRVVVARRPGEAAGLARNALAGGDSFLVAVGDDATVNQLVNGILDRQDAGGAEAVLGVLSPAAECDFTRTFGLPGDIAQAAARLAGDGLYRIDAGKLTFVGPGGEASVTYFVNLAQAGLGAAVTARAAALPASMGRGRRFLSFWLTLARYRAGDVRVTAGGKEYRGRATGIVVGNCQFAGGGVKLSPRSFPGDGLFETLIMKGPKSDWFTMLPKMFQGEHVPDPDIIEYMARTINVDAERPLPVEADGQHVGSTPARFELLPQAIAVKI